MADAMPEVRAEWLERVLGIRVSPGGGEAPAPHALASDPEVFRRDYQKAVAQWQDAVEAVDGQMASLAGVLRQQGDEWLSRIAAFGLNAITGNHKVPLMAALMETSGAAPGALAASAGRTRALAAAFAAHVAADPQVAACDANPFGVAVSVRATLGPALAALEQALARAPAA